MAVIQMSFRSQELMRNVPVSIILPNDLSGDEKNNPAYQRGMKTLYLLHGITGDHTDWLCGTTLQTLCQKYNIAAVCPAGNNSFYLDKEAGGESYGAYIGQELVEYTRKTFGFSTRAEDTFIGGLSMGGYGALRNGLKYSQTFGKIFAFSSALVVYNVWEKTLDFGASPANEAYFRATFGDPNLLENSDKNPEYLVRRLCSQKEALPQIYMTCGTEDALLDVNRRFYGFLKQMDYPVEYKESSGAHTWEYWNEMLAPAMAWLAQ